MKVIEAFDLGIYNPRQLSNVKITVNKAIKEGEVFFGEDFFNLKSTREWEVRFDNSYPNVFYDSLQRIYRCYYSTFTDDLASSETNLDERKNKQYHPSDSRVVSLCYAESEDGINWKKPNLGITEFKGSTNNNIIGMYLHGTSVMFDEYESDCNKRYKMLTKLDYGNGVNYIAVAFSCDGVHFDEFIKCPKFYPRADTHNSVFYDEKIQKYVLVTRSWRDSLRIPCISYSDDFINWSEYEEILHPRGFENQVYSMPIFRHNDYIIGLPSMFHEGDQLDKNYDTVDVELAYSYQYRGWNYIDADNPFIERGKGLYREEGNEFDSHIIFTSLPVVIGDRTYFYYMGGNGKHTDYRETSFSRAYIEYERFSYAEPKRIDHEAKIYTNGFVFLDNIFFIDMDIEEDGDIDIEFYDFYNKRIEVNIKLEKIDRLYKVIFDKDLKNIKIRMLIRFNKVKLYKFKGDFEVLRIENSTN